MSKIAVSSRQFPQWSLPIVQWAIWDDARTTGSKPDLSFVDAMLRRRLSPLARAAFHVAYRCSNDMPGIPMIYASRHGELERTLELFHALAAEEPLSPTSFGLSVLNATAGLYSIARHDTSAATAIAAGSETFGFGLIEAWSRAQAAGSPVVYVYADAPPPSPLGGQATDHSSIFAIGILIDPAANKVIHCSTEPLQPDERKTSQAQALAFASLLDGGQSTEWHSERRLWRWSH